MFTRKDIMKMVGGLVLIGVLIGGAIIGGPVLLGLIGTWIYG